MGRRAAAGALVLVLVGCGDEAGAPEPPAASPCHSVVTEPYASPLPAGDPCRLPGVEAVGGAQPAAADPALPFDPLARGPHPIGVTTMVVAYAERQLTVEVWYPADARAAGQPTDVYTFPESAPGEAIDGVEQACLHIDPLDSGAVRDAAPAPGPFPLLVFSHGTTSTRVQSATLTSHLATHGFVVAAPDHSGDTLLEFFESGGGQNPLEDPVAAGQIAAARVADVSAIIDRLGADAQTGGTCMSGLVADGGAGVLGHSFGGFTALAAAGGSIVGEADPRVAAAMPIAPGGVGYTFGGSDPLLSLGGDLDTSTPFETETRAAHDAATGPRHLVKVVDAGHLTVSDLCLFKLAEQIDIFGFEPCAVCDVVNEGCPGGEARMLETRPALRYFAAAFFTAYLGAGPRAAEARALLDPAGPGPAAFPDAWGVVEAQ